MAAQIMYVAHNGRKEVLPCTRSQVSVMACCHVQEKNTVTSTVDEWLFLQDLKPVPSWQRQHGRVPLTEIQKQARSMYVVECSKLLFGASTR